MKIKIFFVTFLGMILISCSDTKTEEQSFGKTEHMLTIDKNSLSFGGRQNLETTLNIKGENVIWQFEDIPKWLSVNPLYGRNSDVVTITAKQNESADDIRTATILLTSQTPGYSQNYEINITQSAEVWIKPNRESLLFTRWADYDEITIKTNVDWEADCSASWVSLESFGSSVYDNNTFYLLVSVASNDYKARSATINFKRKGTSTTISTLNVHQDEEPSNEKDKIITISGNGKNVTFRMKYVQAGTFMMGTDEETDKAEMPAHRVTLTKDYYIGETEVTQALWYAVTGYSPVSPSDGYKRGIFGIDYFWESKYGMGDEYPAYSITYYECEEFIKKLNEITNYSFRMPTEAEWEYAARGGSKSNGYKYAGSNNIDKVAWYDYNSEVNSRNSSHPVRQKASNELEIYDMTGNVSEYCIDWYDESYYNNSPEINPSGPTSGTYRVIRGGNYESWQSSSQGRICLTGRSRCEPDEYIQHKFGLRLVLPKDD